jgi:hypothetical protein
MGISVQAVRAVKMTDDRLCQGMQRGTLVLPTGVRLEVIAVNGIRYCYLNGVMVFSV